MQYVDVYHIIFMQKVYDNGITLKIINKWITIWEID